MSADISIQSVGGRELIGPWQLKLDSHCYDRGLPLPSYSLFSDRRGSRTAWSCSVTLGETVILARFWYDGRWIRNAREDAACEALQKLQEHERLMSPRKVPNGHHGNRDGNGNGNNTAPSFS